MEDRPDGRIYTVRILTLDTTRVTAVVHAHFVFQPYPYTPTRSTADPRLSARFCESIPTACIRTQYFCPTCSKVFVPCSLLAIYTVLSVSPTPAIPVSAVLALFLPHAGVRPTNCTSITDNSSKDMGYRLPSSLNVSPMSHIVRNATQYYGNLITQHPQFRNGRRYFTDVGSDTRR